MNAPSIATPCQFYPQMPFECTPLSSPPASLSPSHHLLSGFSLTAVVWISNAPQRSCVEGFVPNATTFRVGTLRQQLDCEGSDLINGLTHWWVHNLTGYWEEMQPWEVGHDWRYRVCGACPWRLYSCPQFLPFTPFLLPGCHEVRSSASTFFPP
jgi:hypothetical protein